MKPLRAATYIELVLPPFPFLLGQWRVLQNVLDVLLLLVLNHNLGVLLLLHVLGVLALLADVVALALGDRFYRQPGTFSNDILANLNNNIKYNL